MPTIADVKLVLPGWKRQRGDARQVLWQNQDGDSLILQFFKIPPDIGAPLDDLAALRAFYREVITQAGGGLVQLDVIELCGAAAVHAIFKLPQEAGGMSYVGSMTVPFESCSVMVTSPCEEQGMSGVRDATVFAVADLTFDDTGQPIGWVADPYDATVTGGILRNLADDEQWDEQFPEHPLSRCRRHLQQVRDGLVLGERLRAVPPFAGPQARGAKQWWWPFGGR